MSTKNQVVEAPTDLTGTQLITLDPEKYVAAVYAQFRDRLDAAKADAKDITPDATTKEGMLVAIKQRAIFRSIRIDIDKAHKLRKAPVLEISRKLDGRKNELTAECAPDEERFDSAIKLEETRKERERAEKEAAELARVTKIHEKIAAINATPADAVGRSSHVIENILGELRAIEIDAQEFQPAADDAKARAIAALQQLHAGAVATEKAAADEAASVKAAREELARLRAEQEERNRTEQARIAEETRKRAEEAAAARAKIEAEERAGRARIEAMDRRAAEVREEADRVAREALAEQHARLTAEREAEEARLRAIRQEEDRARVAKDAQDRQERAAREAEAERLAKGQAERERYLRAEQEGLEAARREIARQQEELLKIDELAELLRRKMEGRPQYAAIVAAIDAYFAPRESKSVMKRKAALAGEKAA